MGYLAGTDGRVDMKRIYGITAVEGRVRLGKGVKVYSPFLFSLYLFFVVNQSMKMRIMIIIMGNEEKKE